MVSRRKNCGQRSELAPDRGSKLQSAGGGGSKQHFATVIGTTKFMSMIKLICTNLLAQLVSSRPQKFALFDPLPLFGGRGCQKPLTTPVKWPRTPLWKGFGASRGQRRTLELLKEEKIRPMPWPFGYEAVQFSKTRKKRTRLTKNAVPCTNVIPPKGGM